jgi:phosphopantetheine adenylyltransferase
VTADDEPVRLGVYPGSFHPVTVAHLHIAEAAVHQCGLARVDLTVSRVTLGKAVEHLAPVEERVAVLEELTTGRPWLGVRITPASLLVDISRGYDVVVLGADKWHQVLDPEWYGSLAARDAALDRLPTVALAPRPPWTLPGDDPAATAPKSVDVVVLDTDPAHHPVSATAVRAGRHEWRARP